MIYLPVFECEWTLSRWTGRPHGLSIDPIGVECFVPVAAPKRRLFQRRPAAPAGSPYLHVLVHNDLPSDRIRSWAEGQVAQLGVLEKHPDASGDQFNRLAEAESGRLEDRDWTPATMTVDGVSHAASAFVAQPERWAAYVDLGQDRVVLVGHNLPLDGLALRTASSQEAREVRTAALRV